MKNPLLHLAAVLLAAGLIVPAHAADITVDDIIAVQDKRIVKIDPVTKELTPLMSTDLIVERLYDMAVYQKADGTHIAYIIGTRISGSYGYTSLYSVNPATGSRAMLFDEVGAGLPLTAIFTSVAVENDGNIILGCKSCGANGENQILRVDPTSTATTMKFSVLSQSPQLNSSLEGIDVAPDGYIYVLCRTPPAGLWGVVRIDPDTGEGVRIAFSPGGDDMEMLSPHDLHVSKDGRIFVLDTRVRTDTNERRVIEVNPVTGVQTMLNDSAWVTTSYYKGISVDSTGKIIYFCDSKVSNTGKAGISYLDLDAAVDTDGEYYRRSLLSAYSLERGLDVVTPLHTCSNVTLSPLSQHFSKDGGTVTVSVTPDSPRARGLWRVETDVGWITPSATAGFGEDQVTLTVQFSQETSARSANVTIGDKTIQITQDAGDIVNLEGQAVAPSGTVILNLSGSEKKYFTVLVPSGKDTFTVTLSGLTVDMDLYLRFGAHPDPDAMLWDCNSWEGGTADEICTVQVPSPGTWGILVANYSSDPGTGTMAITMSPASFNIAPAVLLLD